MTNPPKSSHQQSDANYKLLMLVRQYGSAGFSLLFDQFGELDEDQPAARERFQKRLGYLVYSDQLARTGRGNQAVYTLGHLAFKPQPGTRAALGYKPAPRPAPAAIAPPLAAPHPANRAMPNTYDVMRAPVYQGQGMPVLRPGALDYQRYASHGDRC